LAQTVFVPRRLELPQLRVLPPVSSGWMILSERVEFGDDKRQQRHKHDRAGSGNEHHGVPQCRRASPALDEGYVRHAVAPDGDGR
jgi:hypothetical protein